MIEAMKQARQIIWRYRHETPLGNQPHMIAHEADEAIERIDQAIAEAEKHEVFQEPIGWLDEDSQMAEFMHKDLKAEHDKRGSFTPKMFPIPVYTHPPKREWVGLTDEEIDRGQKESWVTKQAWESAVWWAETKLKEKNT